MQALLGLKPPVNSLMLCIVFVLNEVTIAIQAIQHMGLSPCSISGTVNEICPIAEPPRIGAYPYVTSRPLGQRTDGGLKPLHVGPGDLSVFGIGTPHN